MNTAPLAAALVTARQAAAMSHPLAAANHRQWVRWEQWVLRDPARLVPGAAPGIVEAALVNGLGDVLAQDAETVIGIIKGAVGSFAYMPGMTEVTARKHSQFTGWVEYAVTRTPADRERWLLQCRTPFLALPADMQKSDYTEAERDLRVVAEAGGLVLPEPFPELKPQTPRHLRRLRARHALGMHGYYASSEHPWAMICLGCHREWSVTP